VTVLRQFRADQNSSSSKKLLHIFFVITFMGGALAVVDSVRQIAAAGRKQTNKSGVKDDAAP
jgi:hypothetical protein